MYLISEKQISKQNIVMRIILMEIIDVDYLIQLLCKDLNFILFFSLGVKHLFFGLILMNRD